MAFVNEYGRSPKSTYVPNWTGGTPGFGTDHVIDASTERAGWAGLVWHPTVKSGNISIRKIGVSLGTVAVNAASVIRFSLQDVSLTTGPIYQPDGTQDQTVDVAGSTFSSNAWLWTGALSADRTIAIGDRLAVVAEYTTFTAGDSIVFNAVNNFGATMHIGLGGRAILYTGTWGGLSNRIGVIALECADGTYAFLDPMVPVTAFTTTSIASGGAIKRAGAIFRVPTPRKIDEIGLLLAVSTGADGTLVLYDTDGTTQLAAVSVDANAVETTSPRICSAVIPAVTLSAGVDYRVAWLAGATAATLYGISVAAAGLLDGYPGGQQCHHTEHNGTSWSQTTTQRPFVYLGFSAFDDAAGSSGDTGGMRRFNAPFN